MNQEMEQKKEHILKNAESLFALHGYKGTTTRMIAEESKVNLGTLTYYFGTKEDLFKELIKTRIGFYRSNIEAIVKSSTAGYMEMILGIGEIYVDQMMNNVNFHRIMNKEIMTDHHSTNSKVATKYIIENRKQMASIVKSGIKAKQIRNVDVEMFLNSVIGTVLHLVNSECLSLQMMGQDPKKEKINSKKNVKRIKTYIRDYIQVYLNPAV